MTELAQHTDKAVPEKGLTHDHADLNSWVHEAYRAMELQSAGHSNNPMAIGAHASAESHFKDAQSLDIPSLKDAAFDHHREPLEHTPGRPGIHVLCGHFLPIDSSGTVSPPGFFKGGDFGQIDIPSIVHSVKDQPIKNPGIHALCGHFLPTDGPPKETK